MTVVGVMAFLSLGGTFILCSICSMKILDGWELEVVCDLVTFLNISFWADLLSSFCQWISSSFRVLCSTSCWVDRLGVVVLRLETCVEKLGVSLGVS